MKLGAIAMAGALVAAGAGDAAAESALLERGRYLAAIMDCGGCHTYGAMTGQPDETRHLAGSDLGFEIPGLGIFYPPNLTSDEATGLGSWSVEDIKRALREGLRPDGRELAPAMPWRAYSAASEEDMQALASYLKALPAVSYQAPAPVGPDEKPGAPYLTVRVPG